MFKYIKKYWLFALLAPLFMIGEVTMDLLQPRLMRIVIDEGVLGLSNNYTGDLDIVINTGLKMIGFVALGGVFGIMSGVFANLCGQNFGNALRKDSFGRIMSLSFEQTDQFTTGSLITRVTNDITQVQNLVKHCIRGFIRTFLLFAGGIFSMVMLDMSFGYVVVCALPLVIICLVFFLSRTAPKFSILQKRLDRMNNVLQENVSGTRVVKAYVREEYEKERFKTSNDELVSTQLDILLLLSYMTPIMNIILNISVVAVIKIGGIRVEAGAITPGTVMAAITYITQILNAVMRMTMIFQTVSRGVASGKRIMEVLKCEPSIISGLYNEKTKVHGRIEFEHVSFAYPGMGDKKILQDINLSINPGETFAILGSTGCGKTSLIQLIPRFYDATEGRVLVDGIDVKEYDLNLLRSKVAVALQKSEVFSTTIEENIRWGKPDATDDEIESAAKIAQAWDFIMAKEDGINTMVSQGGFSLSGGQKQRVAISRAILKSAEILIFDDSTSALDLRTEAKLYEALGKNYKDVTKIIIAQRIASVKDADRIAILENGTISEIGSHKELLAGSQTYRDIYQSQLKGGEEDGR